MKRDIDDNPVNASRYDVLSIPTVILFAEGEAKEIVVGHPRRSTSASRSPCTSRARGSGYRLRPNPRTRSSGSLEHLLKGGPRVGVVGAAGRRHRQVLRGGDAGVRVRVMRELERGELVAGRVPDQSEAAGDAVAGLALVLAEQAREEQLGARPGDGAEVRLADAADDLTGRRALEAVVARQVRRDEVQRRLRIQLEAAPQIVLEPPPTSSERVASSDSAHAAKLATARSTTAAGSLSAMTRIGYPDSEKCSQP